MCSLVLACAALSAQTPAGNPPATPPASSLGLDTPQVKTPTGPPAAGSQTLDSPGVGESLDRSGQASPVPAGRPGRSLPQGVIVEVKLEQPVSSGTQRNGDSVRGTLVSPLRTTRGAILPAGTPVQATVVSAAKAGTIRSGGVLSLQLTHVGSIGLVSDVRDFDGKEGHKDVADSAPGKGEEATVAPGTALRFEVLETGEATGLMPDDGDAALGGTGQGATGQPRAAAAPAAGSGQRGAGGTPRGAAQRPPTQ